MSSCRWSKNLRPNLWPAGNLHLAHLDPTSHILLLARPTPISPKTLAYTDCRRADRILPYQPDSTEMKVAKTPNVLLTGGKLCDIVYPVILRRLPLSLCSSCVTGLSRATVALKTQRLEDMG
jgi:hypothetical protein